jgi:ribosomal-protein-alanine N-acetyltransferase
MHTNDNLNGGVIFRTTRMICRRWLPSDRDAIFEVYSDPDVVRWVGDGSPISGDEVDAWLGVTAANYERRGYGMFALQEQEGGEVVGFIGLVHPAGQLDAEIKYAFRKSHWGRGLASEIVPALVAYAEESLRLSMVTATVAPENLASQRILMKAGFSFIEERDDEDDASEFYYVRRSEVLPE